MSVHIFTPRSHCQIDCTACGASQFEASACNPDQNRACTDCSGQFNAQCQACSASTCTKCDAGYYADVTNGKCTGRGKGLHVHCFCFEGFHF